MLESITNTLQQVSSQPIGLVFAFILGLLSALTSACCTIPALGILVGYSGSKANENCKAALKSTLFFTLGIIASLIIVGLVAGFVGQIAQTNLGKYWSLFAGIIAILLGLASLKLLPFKTSFGKFEKLRGGLSKSGVVLTGIVLGGIVAVSSLPCNPGIFIVIGAAILQGKVFWSVLMLAMFAVGFGIPLGVLLLGISMSKVCLAAKGLEPIIRWISGLIMLIAGFYFLVMF
ncbi:MAG TPA: hypothetical protein DD381_02960 [Lentisphaeria bacterium]|nr:MAG: hypothetical protein A2X47_03290 [Lentisphaerae bacterium GWF2_38_69]HBM15293.1 hypothetical protein [Lentisphaeria bacterium]